MDTDLANLQLRLAAIRQMPSLLPEQSRLKHNIKDLEAGGYLRVDGRVYRVDNKYHYVVSKNDEWFELVLYCMNDGSETYMDWYEDDGLIIYIQEQELSLEETGVSKKDLRTFDDDEEGSFAFRGITYKYSDSNKATFFREANEEGEKFYFWDFDASDSTLIGFELWGTSDYRAYLSRKVDKRVVEVLLPGGAG